MDNTRCKDCAFNGRCSSKKKFKKFKKKCKKLEKKYKGLNIKISCIEYLNELDDLLNDNNIFDDEFDTGDFDTDAEAEAENSDNLDVSKSLSEIELLNKNIELLINLLQNKLK